jgi:hypothetical protein
MTADRISPSKEEPSFIPHEDELQRQLIEEFYESSVERYGIDSEQAQVFSRFLGGDIGQRMERA